MKAFFKFLGNVSFWISNQMNQMKEKPLSLLFCFIHIMQPFQAKKTFFFLIHMHSVAWLLILPRFYSKNNLTFAPSFLNRVCYFRIQYFKANLFNPRQRDCNKWPCQDCRVNLLKFSSKMDEPKKALVKNIHTADLTLRAQSADVTNEAWLIIASSLEKAFSAFRVRKTWCFGGEKSAKVRNVKR